MASLTLENNLNFQRKVHRQNIEQVKSLAFHDTTEKNRKNWTKAIADSMDKLKDSFDLKLELMKEQFEANCNHKELNIGSSDTHQKTHLLHSNEEGNNQKVLEPSLGDKQTSLQERNDQNKGHYPRGKNEKRELINATVTNNDF